LNEGEAALPDGGDLGVICNSCGLYSNMYNDWVVCELVEVWYRLYKDGGSSGNGNQLAGSRRSVGREKRVGVLADDLNLYLSLETD